VEFYPSNESASIEDLIAHGAGSDGRVRLPVDRDSAGAVSGIVRWWPSSAGGTGGASEARLIRVPTRGMSPHDADHTGGQ